nr:phenoloxidase-activating factor 1-like [Penaeus vannamei]
MAGKEVTLSGWGKTETGSLSSSLREYDTVGYSLPDCISFYGSWMRPTQMCTDGAQRKHTCSGDSGGPVMRIENGKVFQVGVISFGASADCKDQSPDGQMEVVETLVAVALGVLAAVFLGSLAALALLCYRRASSTKQHQLFSNPDMR